MYEKWTDRARKVMTLANEEARRLNHEYIGTEHILVGLCKEGNGVAGLILREKAERLIVRVREIVQAGPPLVSALARFPLTPRAKKVVESANATASMLHCGYVGTEHVLCGLLHTRDGVAAAVLTDVGFTLEGVLDTIGKLRAAARSVMPANVAPAAVSHDARYTLDELAAALAKLGVATAGRFGDPTRWSVTDLITDLRDVLAGVPNGAEVARQWHKPPLGMERAAWDAVNFGGASGPVVDFVQFEGHDGNFDRLIPDAPATVTMVRPPPGQPARLPVVCVPTMGPPRMVEEVTRGAAVEVVGERPMPAPVGFPINAIVRLTRDFRFSYPNGAVFRLKAGERCIVVVHQTDPVRVRHEVGELRLPAAVLEEVPASELEKARVTVAMAFVDGWNDSPSPGFAGHVVAYDSHGTPEEITISRLPMPRGAAVEVTAEECPTSPDGKHNHLPGPFGALGECEHCGDPEPMPKSWLGAAAALAGTRKELVRPGEPAATSPADVDAADAEKAAELEFFKRRGS